MFKLSCLVLCTLVNCFLCGTGKAVKLDQETLKTIFLRYYVGTAGSYVDQSYVNASLLVSKMEKHKPTVIYIHGFTESVESASTSTVVNAFVKRNSHNVIAVDYREISNKRYVILVKHVEELGTVLAEAVDDMVTSGLDRTKLYIVGHSLGAQIAGSIGRKVSFQIPRITGLDPAGPFFHFIYESLSSEDAAFVDVIHTDSGFYGTSKSQGSVDFFPNGGHRVQPGCPYIVTLFSDREFCSHRRSWKYYSESVLNETAFVGVKCETEFGYVVGNCVGSDVVAMGFATPSNASGRYFLFTSNTSPYGMGVEGIKLSKQELIELSTPDFM